MKVAPASRRAGDWPLTIAGGRSFSLIVVVIYKAIRLGTRASYIYGVLGCAHHESLALRLTVISLFSQKSNDFPVKLTCSHQTKLGIFLGIACVWGQIVAQPLPFDSNWVAERSVGREPISCALGIDGKCHNQLRSFRPEEIYWSNNFLEIPSREMNTSHAT